MGGETEALQNKWGTINGTISLGGLARERVFAIDSTLSMKVPTKFYLQLLTSSSESSDPSRTVVTFVAW